MKSLSRFSQQLAKAIAASGMRKAAVARAIGVTPGTLSRYLNGQIVPDQPVLLLLAQQLHVSVDYLHGRDRQHTALADTPVVCEDWSAYPPDAVALTGLDADERRTVLRLLDALRSGDAEIRRHLIGQLKIIETALRARRQQPREEREDGA